MKDVVTVNNRNYIIMTIAVPNGLRDSILDLFHTVILEADKNGNAISFYYLYKFIDFYESNNRRDDDGVMHGMKYILDGLQEAGIIKNDSPKYCHVLPEVLRSQKKDGNGKIVDYIEISIYESVAVR